MKLKMWSKGREERERANEFMQLADKHGVHIIHHHTNESNKSE